jgi:serine/threonine-protein kinase RsbW
VTPAAAELVRLEIPAQPAFVGVARTVVTAVVTSVEGIAEERLEDLRIAVSEACTNAVEAHQADSVVRRVVLRCLLDDDTLEVRIEDSGGGFAPSDLDERDLADPEALAAERGWGIQLIRALVDDVAFDTDGEGTAVRLLMHRAEVAEA